MRNISFTIWISRMNLYSSILTLNSLKSPTVTIRKSIIYTLNVRQKK